MKKLIISTILLLLCITGCHSSSGQKEEELNYEDNGLPILYLQIDPEEFTKVNESKDHSYRASGATLSISVPEGYSNAYADEISGTDALELEYILFDAGYSAKKQKQQIMRIIEKLPFTGSFSLF